MKQKASNGVQECTSMLDSLYRRLYIKVTGATVFILYEQLDRLTPQCECSIPQTILFNPSLFVLFSQMGHKTEAGCLPGCASSWLNPTLAKPPLPCL